MTIKEQDELTGFTQVIKYDQMNYRIDQVGGEDIKPGRYTVRFPDGTLRDYDVKIYTRLYDSSDMGHYQQGSEFKAYIIVDYHGVKMQLYIKGLYVKWLHETP